MLTRRGVILSGLALSASLGLPAFAQEDNPMPTELRRALERSTNAPVLGNPDGNITLTEFFDYNCPHCRKMVPVVHRLISEDQNLRVVFREWPVFGEGSTFAARASLASLQQGKYWQFHNVLMEIRGRVEERSVMAAAEKLGLDTTKLRRDMEAASVTDHIATTGELGDHMGLVGTPTFICGNEALFGQQSQADMRDFIARGRKALSV